jgi:molybdopterin biosynthesis enzyme
MGNIKDQWQATANIFHGSKAQHIHYQIIVAHAGAALAEHDFVIAALAEFIHYIAHLTRAEKLWLFNVDH